MATSSFFGILLFLLLGLSIPLPLGIPPRTEDPALIRAVPRDALAAVQWFGVASADPRSGNVAERFAANAEVRHLFAEVDRAAMAWCMAKEARSKDAPIGPLQAAGLLRVALTNPGVAFLAGFDPAAGPGSLRAGLVLRLSATAEGAKPAPSLFETLKSVQTRLEQALGHGQSGADVAVGSASARVLALPAGLPRVVFGWRGDHVFVAAGDGVAEALVQGLERQDGLGAQPAFATLHAQVRVERPVLRAFVDVGRMVQLGLEGQGEAEHAIFARLGLDAVRQLVLENGMEGEAMRSRAFLGLAGPPTGLLEALAGAPLAAADLAPVPADASTALAVRLEAKALVDAVQALLGTGPVPMLFGGLDAAEHDPATEDLIAAARADLVAGLGNAVTLWNAPGQGGFWFTGATAAVPVRDAAAAARAHERILAHLRQQMPPRASLEKDFALAQHLETAAQQLNALQAAVASWSSEHDGKLPGFDDLDAEMLGHMDLAREAGKPPVDPWGRPYRIVSRDGEATATSDGPDRQSDTDDDLRRDNAWERSMAASGRGTTLEQTTFGARTIHYLNPRGWQPFAPAWCLSDTHLVVSLNLSVLKAALAHLQAREADLAGVPAVADALGGAMLFAQNTRSEFPFLYGIGKIAATFFCRSLQEDGFDLTVDALPSAVAFRDVLGHELLSLRHAGGGFVLERRGRLPSLLGVPLFPMPFLFGTF